MDVDIAARLQKLRKEHNLSQEQLADELGVSRQAVSKWERAEASPDTDNLILLAKLYGMPIDDLLFEHGGLAETVKAEEAAETVKADDSVEIIKTEEVTPDTEAQNGEGRHKRDVVGIVGGLSVFLSALTFVLLGTLLGKWHPTWVVFLAIPLFPSLAEAIISRNAEHFAYPVFVAALYVIIGAVWHWWHPGWFVFLTIPVYYLCVDAIQKKH